MSLSVYLMVSSFTCPYPIYVISVGFLVVFNLMLWFHGEANFDKGFPGGAPFWGPGPNPPGALKVGVKTLLRSWEGSREAESHVGSCGMALWRVHSHTWGQGFVAVHHPRQ